MHTNQRTAHTNTQNQQPITATGSFKPTYSACLVTRAYFVYTYQPNQHPIIAAAELELPDPSNATIPARLETFNSSYRLAPRSPRPHFSHLWLLHCNQKKEAKFGDLFGTSIWNDAQTRDSWVSTLESDFICASFVGRERGIV